MNEHTPAPWNVEETEWGAKVVDCQEVTVADLPQQPADTWRATANAALVSKAPEMYELLLELAGCLKQDEFADKLTSGLHDILETVEPAETGILWDKVLEAAKAEEPQETFDGDEKARYVFLGTAFALYPSGKYWVFPIAYSNVNILEMVRDTMYNELLQEEAEKHGGWIECGEGDPCDILVVFPADMEDAGEPNEEDA